MRPSQYNYIKRAFTRTMSQKRGSAIIDLILFPFRLSLYLLLFVIVTGFYILYYGTKIVFKLLFKFIKFLFKYLGMAFVGLIIFSKKYIKNEIKLFKKYKKESEYKNFLNKSEEINIPDMIKKFNINSSEAIEIVSDIKIKDNL